MEKKRDLTLDIAKAICIILMVVGHSFLTHNYWHNFIYMFHMPCFFFISRWLLSDKYLADLKTGLMRKAKGSYWAFVKWSLIFLLFHNLLAQLHIYGASYSLREFVIKIVRIFTLTGSEQLLGGFWFLISLFWASVASLLFLWLLNRIGRLTNICISGGVIFALLFAVGEKWLPVHLPQQFGSQTMMATAFYLTGYLSRRVGVMNRCGSSWMVLLLAIPAVAAMFMDLGMMTTTGLGILPYYVISMCGTLGVLGLSKWMVRHRISIAFKYVGDKTLYILIFHLLAFKLVSYAYIVCNDLPITILSQFPVMNGVPSWLWVVYLIVGVSVSLLMWEVINRISNKIKTIKTNSQNGI